MSKVNLWVLNVASLCGQEIRLVRDILDGLWLNGLLSCDGTNLSADVLTGAVSSD